MKSIEDFHQKILRTLTRNRWVFEPEMSRILWRFRHKSLRLWLIALRFECSCCTGCKYIHAADLLFCGVEPQREYNQWEYWFFGGHDITPPPVVCEGSDYPINMHKSRENYRSKQKILYIVDLFYLYILQKQIFTEERKKYVFKETITVIGFCSMNRTYSYVIGFCLKNRTYSYLLTVKYLTKN